MLVDPAPFDAHETLKITIRNEFFTDEIAKEYSDKKTIFISDIRANEFGASKLSEEEKNECVVKDMEMQRKWHEILKPKATTLKFRLPYAPADTEKVTTTRYLKGDIFFPVWSGRTSTECRLVVTTHATEQDDNCVEYNNRDYESACFHYQTETRTTYHDHNVHGDGLDHCYDCMSEIFILSNYLRTIKGITDEAMIERIVGRMSAQISREISRGRTLVLRMH